MEDKIAWPEFSICPRAAVVLPLQHAALPYVCVCVCVCVWTQFMCLCVDCVLCVYDSYGCSCLFFLYLKGVETGSVQKQLPAQLYTQPLQRKSDSLKSLTLARHNIFNFRFMAWHQFWNDTTCHMLPLTQPPHALTMPHGLFIFKHHI